MSKIVKPKAKKKIVKPATAFTDKPDKILALDLATKCGFASVERKCSTHPDQIFVEDCGTINFGSDPIKRWLTLEKEITSLFKRFLPLAIVIETNFVYKNIATTALLNQLRGAILLLAALNNISVCFIDNNVAKKYLFGSTKYWDVKSSKYLGISKEMMYDRVSNNICNHSIKPQDYDSADAIALSLTFYKSAIELISLPKRD